MNSWILEWVNLLVRWFHVFAGIMWVGQTYYFTWLDGQLRRLEKAAAGDAKESRLWMVHSGGFYTVEKQTKLGVAPELLHWFRWEAAFTWLSGMILLVLVYYMGGALLDPDVANISLARGGLIGLGVIAGGWLVYDLAVRSAIGKSELVFAVFSIVVLALLAWALSRVFSGRAVYIHVGALMGTIMAANVWSRILPAQRKMIAAAATGAKFDTALGARAKLRTKHNTYMAVPVVLIMVSNHFPSATYGNSYGWEMLVALILAGWVAARIIRGA